MCEENRGSWCTFEIFFVSFEHAIEPGEDFLGTMVAMHHNGAVNP